MKGFSTIRAKILVWVLICLVAACGVIVTISIYLARAEAMETARHAAMDEAIIQALKIAEEFNNSFVVASNLRTTLLTAQANAQSRANIVDLLTALTLTNKKYVGLWAGWDTNSFDGKDANAKASVTSDSTGRFLPYVSVEGSTTTSSLLDITESSAAEWYHGPLKHGKIGLTNPYIYPVAGKNTLLVSVYTPHKGNAPFVSGLDVSADFVQQMVDEWNDFDGKALLSVVSHGHIFVARKGHPETVGKPVVSAMGQEASAEIAEAFRAGNVSVTWMSDAIRVWAPIKFAATDQLWMLSMRIPNSVAFASVHALTTSMAVVGGVSVILVAIVMWFVANMISTPIKRTAEVVTRIAGGNFAARCIVEGRDEVANMQNAVNGMAETIQKNLEEVRHHASEAETRSHQAEEATRRAEEASRRAESAKREGMLQAAEKLDSVVKAISGAAGDLSACIKQSDRGARDQASKVDSTAAAMEEMNSTVLEVAKNASGTSEVSATAREKAEEGAKIVSGVIREISVVRTKSDDLRSDMQALGKQANDIGQIMNVISDIADQTNLLALNAAIEAARAGDAGRGFAVVADEVRKLAEKTMHATSEVGSAIKGIQQGTAKNIGNVEQTSSSIGEATNMAQQSGESLKEIVGLVEIASDRVRGIATASEEQSATSEEITRALDGVRQISGETAKSMEEATKIVNGLAKQADVLARLVEDLKTP